jgi:hypothetical protein
MPVMSLAFWPAALFSSPVPVTLIINEDFDQTDIQPAPPQESVIFGLLDASAENLRSQGMTKMFIDGVANDFDFLMQLGEPPVPNHVALWTNKLGFREWAEYRDVWKDI